MASAQALRKSGPPAEFPPASFKGKQYIDSRGCVYVRAGIDGNVTWVPRVNRQRQLLCGFRPSLSGSQLARAQSGGNGHAVSGAPEEITLAPQDRRTSPAAPKARAPRVAAAKPSSGPEPTVFGTPAPRRAEPATPAAPKAKAPLRRKAPSPGPEPTVFGAPAPEQAQPAAPAARKTRVQAQRRTPSPGPAPTVFSGPAPRAEAVPKTPAPRRAKPARKPSPAPAPTVVSTSPKPAPAPQKPKRRIVRAKPESQQALPAGTRIVRRHIDERRQNTTNVKVPAGYRSVWTDGRLNPARAERTQKPSLATARPQVPRGYRAAWRDERLSLRRAQGTGPGNAATDAIWTRSAPRQLVRQPARGRDALAHVSARNGNSAFWTPPVQTDKAALGVARVSTRSEPAQRPTLATKPRYVRVATYAGDAAARQAARSLARSGLPMRLGTLTRGAKKYRVVLAGPFPDQSSAKAALARLHQAGYSNAKLGK